MKQPMLLIILFLFSGIKAYNSQEVSQALQQKDAPRALALLRQAQQENPSNGTLLLQMAVTLFFMHRYPESADYYERALQPTPDNINIRHNCALAHSICGNFCQAIHHYEYIYQKDPTNEHVKIALLKHYIRSQQWHKAHQIFCSQLWWYDENIYGKRIYIDLDIQGNGLGDSILFLHYIQLLKQAGATTIVKAPTPLQPLLHRCTFIDQLFTNQDTEPPADKKYNICIASLLLCMKDQLGMQAPVKPSLSADPELVTYWKTQVNPDQLNVGICWQSNYVRDRFTHNIIPSPRSISLEKLQPLNNEHITFYSLQKDASPETTPFPLVQFHNDFDESHGRFMDTAALIMNMDLIITVDTSIAHLAGALGKPVLLLLSCESDYRWFVDSDFSPLYPNMKLFRQHQYGDWSHVINQLKHYLQKKISSKGS